MEMIEEPVVSVRKVEAVGLSLTARQKELLLEAAAELVRASVYGDSGVFADPTLAGAADQMVSGAFVSLKRGKHLRSCCGGMVDPPVPLGKALENAAVTTALEDVRFPAVSPIELEHLDMEVWVLHSPKRIEARGEDRVGAVIVGGKHGLVVERGGSRGLLLPGVAVENDWDAGRFLEQVCIKAGLHPTLWKDDATIVFTFEGEPIRGKVVQSNIPADQPRSQTFFGSNDLFAYAEFCRSNITATLWGATPSYYLFGAPDGNVTGVVLSLGTKDAPGEMHLSQLSLRPAVPLQSTLFSLSQAAAQNLANQGIQADGLEMLQVTLSIFYDPAMHGSVTDPHPAGIDPRHRAVLVMERTKAGIYFNPERSTDELIAEAARLAQVRTPAAAPVYSLAVQSTRSELAVSTAPRPVAGPAIRPPGVAGQFYPADSAELDTLVDELLNGETAKQSWAAAMVPHAGLVYSGRIAADVFKRIKLPDTIIVIGPKHTPFGTDWAIAPHQMWMIPGHTIPSDPELARELAEAIPGLELDAQAHQREHGIEVELPFIARLAPKARVIGIAIGSGDLQSCRKFAEGLAGVLRKRQDRPLLVISSDMNHFATDIENRRLDEMALAALERLDPAELYRTVTEKNISMCGVLPAVIVLETLRNLGGLEKAERVGYATTADMTHDTSRVVGYAGMLFR
jgi:AmmeMemoRadiSam system protein B/AmmeMemoRadiSam system protein A